MEDTRGRHSTGIIVAIDPDADRNGIARLDVGAKALEIKALPFPETLDYLQALKSAPGSCEVVIEAGWLNQSHWHTRRGDSGRVIAAKGNSVGRNHEVGRKIAEMCGHWGIPFRLVKPLRKIWKGKDGKITAEELERLLVSNGIRFEFTHSNQEQRDACLLTIWHYKS